MKLSLARVIFQVFLHAVLVGHVLAYYFLGSQGIGALDFQAFFHYFLGDGLLTAGAVLAIAVYGGALLFGRLFCSWGCHFGATQDLAAWVLRKAGWKPPLVRTRILHLAPFLVLAVVFVVPLVERWRERAWGPLRADMAAVPPWDTLPGWVGSMATFLGCGLLILLFLGTRGFCRFVCPYGAIFRVTDFVAPFRVRKVSPCSSGCASSGVHPCTAACPTAIDVHRETSIAGRVTSVDCVRCNLCIEACPSHALAHVTAAAARSRLAGAAVSPAPAGTTFREIRLHLGAPAPEPEGARYDLPLWGELLVLALAIVTYAAIDLVYGGHFLAATLALGEGYLAFAALRAIRRARGARAPDAPERAGAWTLADITRVGVFALSLVPVFEAGAFKWLRRDGLRLDPGAAVSDAPLAATGPQAPLDPAARSRLELAANRYRSALELVPFDIATRKLLLSAYVRLQDRRAIHEAEELERRAPDAASAATLEWVRSRFARQE